MSFLTGKYAVYIFGAIGAVSLIIFIVLGVKLFKKLKASMGKASKLKKSVGKKKGKAKTDSIKEITKVISLVAKKSVLPSFLCIYEGSSKDMIAYVKGLSPSDEYDITAINDSLFVMVSSKRIVFVSPLAELNNIDIEILNKLLNKNYKSGYIKVPLLLVCFTEKQSQSGLYVLFRKVISQIDLFKKFEFDFHITMDLKIGDKKMSSFYELVKKQTAFVITDNVEEGELEKTINDSMESIHHVLSQHIASINELNETVYEAVQVASELETTFKSFLIFIRELDEIKSKVKIKRLVINFGIHHVNYNYTIFDVESLTFEKKMTFFHYLAGSLGLISIIVSLGFIYDIYQINAINTELAIQRPFEGISDGNLKAAEVVYGEWENIYDRKLLFGALYLDKGVVLLNRLYGSFIAHKIIRSKIDTEKTSIDKAIYLSLLIAQEPSDVVDILRQQGELISLVTGLNTKQLNLLYKFGTYDNMSNFPLVEPINRSQEPVLNLDALPSNQLIFDNIVSVNNNELNKLLWGKVVRNRKICLLSNILPDMIPELLSKRETSNSKSITDYLSSVNKRLPRLTNDCGDDLLLMLTNIIPAYHAVDIDSFSEAVNLIMEYNNKIDALFESNKQFSSEKNRLKNMLMRAELNSILQHIMSNEHGEINFIDSKDYYQYSVKTSFSRSVVKVSLAYTKSVILDFIDPALETYKKLEAIFKQLNINYSTLDEMKNDELSEYANEYVSSMEYLLSSSVPSNVSSDNLQMYLTDLSSDNTPFDNIIKFINKNTTFSDTENIPEGLTVIKDKFSGFNDFVKSKEYGDYKNILLSIKRTLKQGTDEDYLKTYQQLSSSGKDSLSGQIDDLIATLDNADDSIYNVFKFPLETLKSLLSERLISSLQTQWSMDVTPKISIVESQFPFDFKAKKSIDPEALNNMFGVQGTVYSEMTNMLQPFSYFDQTTNVWKVRRDLTSPQQAKVKPYVTTLNHYYHLQSYLWDETGKPKNIKFRVKAQPFKNVTLDGKTKMVLTFMYVGDEDKSLGLNTASDSYSALNYAWQLQPSVSVGWLNTSNNSFQQSYTGNWAFFKMLAAAKCSRSRICTWKINDNNTQTPAYQVSFRVESDILKLFKSNT